MQQVTVMTLRPEVFKAAVLDLLRTDPEVQGAVLALLAGALGAAPTQPADRRERVQPDWVRRVLAESDRANAEAAG